VSVPASRRSAHRADRRSHRFRRAGARRRRCPHTPRSQTPARSCPPRTPHADSVALVTGSGSTRLVSVACRALRAGRGQRIRTHQLVSVDAIHSSAKHLIATHARFDGTWRGAARLADERAVAKPRVVSRRHAQIGRAVLVHLTPFAPSRAQRTIQIAVRAVLPAGPVEAARIAVRVRGSTSRGDARPVEPARPFPAIEHREDEMFQVSIDARV